MSQSTKGHKPTTKAPRFPKAEYFKGGSTGTCKDNKCKKVFEKKALRLALTIQPSSLTGKVTSQWFHFSCFFKNHEPECVGDIRYFESLRWEDQERIKEAVKNVKKSEIDEEDDNSANDKFGIEYSRYSAAKCRKCLETIYQKDIRVSTSKLHYNPKWYHLDCFAKVRYELKFLSSGEKLRGIETLADDDKSRVKNALPKASKKIIRPSDEIYTRIKNPLPMIELDDEAFKLKKVQNEKMYEYRDDLAKLLPSTLEKLLKENGQDVPSDKDAMLNRLADAMTFGALKRCSTCKKGQLEFRSGLSGMSYFCFEEDEWSRCASYFDEPPRDLFVVPKDLKRTGKKFLKEYTCVKTEKRIFERNPPSASTIALNKGLISESSALKTAISSTSVKLKVQDGTAVDPQCANGQNKCVYRDANGNIYSASLTLTDLQAGKNSYCNIQVLVRQGRSGYVNRWHGYQNPYLFFQSWGEIGVSGLCKEESFRSVKPAIEKFLIVFEQQTGNEWADRQTFKKVPGKKVILDVSYGQDAVDKDDADKKYSSNLDKSVQELIKLIFDRTLMQNAVMEMELDLNKMPLGKLSGKQIQEAYKVLAELQDYISVQENRVDQKTVVGLSNKFYSLIPHNFATADSLLLDTLPAIQKKLEMLDLLKEIEIAYSLMLKDKPDQQSVIDSRYEELKTKLRPVDPTEDVYKILKRCVQTTHAQTHDGYTLDIVQIFEAERQGEDERTERYKTMRNRKLLWHGSRITNFAGILSQGLRISPPGASHTGSMFGSGIYFADMVSKAANYCQPNQGIRNTGLLLLCEVALGHMKHLFAADCYLKHPPRGFNSVKGVGHTEPNPFQTKELYNDAWLGSGHGVPSSVNPVLKPCITLLYNEYIVYDVAQVKIKYLLQVKFNFKN